MQAFIVVFNQAQLKMNEEQKSVISLIVPTIMPLACWYNLNLFCKVTIND